MLNRSKEPVRQKAIVTKLRDKIVRGTLRPGARLPTRLALAVEFDTTVVTVHRALTKLTGDGFVTASGSRGTFVSKNPPHLSHYGLIFGYRPEEPAALFGLAKAVRDTAFLMERTEARRFSVYFYTGYEMHKTEDFDRLVRGVLTHTLAGLIFVESPHRMRNSPVLQVPGIPRVAMMSEAVLPGVAAVSVDQNGFFDRALDHLRERGCRRVSILSSGYNSGLREYVTAAAVQRGLELRPYWWQMAGVDSFEWATNAAHMLLNDRQLDRPDGMIIGDEILVDCARAGIAAAGVQIGKDVQVVAHCNLPRASGGISPIKWLGFDTRSMLHACINHIDQVRQGESPPELTLIPARFEDEANEAAAVSAQAYAAAV